VPEREQLGAQMRAEKPGAAGHQNFLHLRTFMIADDALYWIGRGAAMRGRLL
jgi:hypothetical protein